MEYSRFAVVVAGSDPGGWFPEIRADDFVACADGGYSVCKPLGIKPNIVIGDFDSLSAEDIAEIDSLGIERITYPPEKDDTDTMLCIRYGLERGFERFLIIGGIGGAFGHTMANLQVLSFLADSGCEAEIAAEHERILMADGGTTDGDGEAIAAKPVVINGQPGIKFSVFSYSERCTGVYIKNAKYELNDVALTHSYPLGVSNEFTEKGPVSISVRKGRLLILIHI